MDGAIGTEVGWAHEGLEGEWEIWENALVWLSFCAQSHCLPKTCEVGVTNREAFLAVSLSFLSGVDLVCLFCFQGVGKSAIVTTTEIVMSSEEEKVKNGTRLAAENTATALNMVVGRGANIAADTTISGAVIEKKAVATGPA